MRTASEQPDSVIRRAAGANAYFSSARSVGVVFLVSSTVKPLPDAATNRLALCGNTRQSLEEVQGGAFADEQGSRRRCDLGDRLARPTAVTVMFVRRNDQIRFHLTGSFESHIEPQRARSRTWRQTRRARMLVRSNRRFGRDVAAIRHPPRGLAGRCRVRLRGSSGVSNHTRRKAEKNSATSH